MLLAILAALFATVVADCDVSSFGEANKDLAVAVCRVEEQLHVVQNALQELLQRTDITIPDEEGVRMEKRKNEFIRFGKRSAENIKRKNEFIRFGKRKNEFIRFGRSDPLLLEELPTDKRKNEFIRFG
ncbi:unnamed protein product [Caenorhabditis auriculariae]|uniref:Uncharacterized protein n=1 Tax=Caenorhabditis auriculariae TaxID=2777116 RepID=A0A8S1GYF4_9PELO|nr:unnamed protein product [Caenorhabditis auriculariae]